MACDRHFKDGSIQEERKDPPSNKFLSWESVTSTCCNISQVKKTLHPIYVGLDFDSPTTPSMTWRTTYDLVKTLGHLWCHHSPLTARCSTLHFLQVCLSRCCRSCIFLRYLVIVWAKSIPVHHSERRWCGADHPNSHIRMLLRFPNGSLALPCYPHETLKQSNAL